MIPAKFAFVNCARSLGMAMAKSNTLAKKQKQHRFPLKRDKMHLQSGFTLGAEAKAAPPRRMDPKTVVLPEWRRL